MMAQYDVFLAHALADREKAELIVRRLRALKFKVRHDKKREHTEPTPRDLRDADNSQTVLVLWSKAAIAADTEDSAWVRAMAEQAGSKPGVLLQAGLDASEPVEPFNADTRYALSGMGPRKLVKGYYDLVDELGRRDGRSDLSEWLKLKAGDKDGKALWKENHPSDPLSRPTGAKAAAAAPKPEEPVAAPPERTVIPPITRSALNPPKAPTGGGDDVMGRIMLLAVALVLAIMLLMSALMSSAPLATSSSIGVAPQTVVAQCPPGEIPAYLLQQNTQTLEPGVIIDDTGE